MKNLKIFQVFLLMIVSLITGRGLISRGTDVKINHKEAKVEIGDSFSKGAGVAGTGTLIYFVANKIFNNGNQKDQDRDQEESIEIPIVEKKPEEVDQDSIVVEQRKQEKKIADEQESSSEIFADEERESQFSSFNDEELKNIEDLSKKLVDQDGLFIENRPTEKKADENLSNNGDNSDSVKDDEQSDKAKKNLISLLMLNEYAKKDKRIDNSYYFIDLNVKEIKGIRFRKYSEKNELSLILILEDEIFIELKLKNDVLTVKYENTVDSLSGEHKKVVKKFVKNIESQSICEKISSLFEKNSPFENKELKSELSQLQQLINQKKALIRTTNKVKLKDIININDPKKQKAWGDYPCFEEQIEVNGELLRLCAWESRPDVNINNKKDTDPWYKILIYSNEANQKIPLYSVEIGLARPYSPIVLDFTNGKYSFLEAFQQQGYNNMMVNMLNDEKKDLIEYLKALNQTLQNLK